LLFEDGGFASTPASAERKQLMQALSLKQRVRSIAQPPARSVDNIEARMTLGSVLSSDRSSVALQTPSAVPANEHKSGTDATLGPQ
jgi:hypothetical protein